MDAMHTVYVHFERDESRDVIIFDHTLTSDEKQLCYDSGYNDIALENCVAMVPIKYTGNYTHTYYTSVLPKYIPIYSWEFGRSCYTIQRTCNDRRDGISPFVLTLNLYSDVEWAKWTRDLANRITTTLNHITEDNHA